VYPVVPYGIEAIWVGLGLAALRGLLAPRGDSVATVVVSAVGAVLVG
jgi:hypothetical protein